MKKVRSWFGLATMMGVMFALLTAVGASALQTGDPSEPVSDDGIVPVFVDGNPTCVDLGYAYGFKPQDNGGDFDEGAFVGNFPSDPANTLSIGSDGVYVDWTSTLGIDAVIVKGGSNANNYVYEPPEESFGDSGLASPINPNNGQPFGLSHVEFCYDYEVDVSKTADTTFTRTYTWSIDKVGDQTDLTLTEGQSFVVNYDVTVDVASFADTDWAVSGIITIENPDPFSDATIESVSDVVSEGINATVDCGNATFPYSLASADTLECDYSAALPNGDSRTNTATVTTSGAVGGGMGSADVTFGEPTTVVDDCIDVSDDKYGELGTVCVGDAPKTFEYSLTVGPYEECGEYTFDNTASFVTVDSETTGSEGHSVNVTVTCQDDSCTLTQGYWKTHSAYGPAPYDDTWALIGEDTTFFQSDKSYYEVLWTPPAGNVYYNLAHQYIAATLNGLNGSNTSAVSTQLAAAEDLLETKTPAEVAGLKGAARKTWVDLASALDDYNNGVTGPGHCSEDALSA